ncbi:serine hydroxymethyltransferase [Candidatus Falkowbacteria bacterium]|nr:MAG: serine hydroxymethyltransferase [Candidatus Falkowbacteria bacterium]
MKTTTLLSQTDSEISDLINKETQRQANELELIASENYVSPAVLEALASPLANKYSEGYSGHRYYGGNTVIDEVETLAIERAKKLFGAEAVNVQPLSGSPANAAIYLALLKPGDTVLGLRLDHGGHLSHGHPINFSGLMYNFVHYGLNAEGRIDMNQVRELALQKKPKMIVAGFSAYSRDVDWQEFKNIADEVGALTFADISHPAGLIVAGVLSSPVPFFDVVMTTTHKTLRGPRGAIIMSKEIHAKAINRAVFPGIQGGPHDNMTAAKAVAFGEALQPDFKVYAQRVITNAQTMATEFTTLGYDIISGGTDNHLFVIDLRNKNITGKEAEKVLEKIGISVSRSTIPNDPNPPLNPSGIRLGTAAITTRGCNQEDCILISKTINTALENKENEATLEVCKQTIQVLCSKYPLPY